MSQEMPQQTQQTQEPQMETTYIPALRYRALTSFYDPLIHWALREETFKTRLVAQAHIEPGNRVLDLGCGTGTLTVLAALRHPDAEVMGLDGDPAVLSIARAKAAHRGLRVQLDHGLSYALPYPDESFDRVLSSLVFHHLTYQDKLRTLHEVARVLRPGGELHLADWGRAQNPVMRASFLLVQVLDGVRTTEDNVQGKLPLLIAAAGFTDVRETGHYATLFGTLALYAARLAR